MKVEVGVGTCVLTRHKIYLNSLYNLFLLKLICFTSG